jgi:hypothetical protein
MFVMRLDGAHAHERFATDRAQSLPLPAHQFDARKKHLLGVSQRSLLCIEGAYYSAPCEWAGLDRRAIQTPWPAPSTTETRETSLSRKRTPKEGDAPRRPMQPCARRDIAFVDERWSPH